MIYIYIYIYFIEDEIEPFNKSAVEGISMQYIKNIEKHLDSIMKSAISTINEDIGLVYKGYRRLTPKEDYYNNVNSSMSKNIVDISKSYLIKAEYGFDYRGIPINRIIALPYVDRGGIIKLSDVPYAIVPVLSEYPISPSPGELFVRLLRDKFIIKRINRNILINGNKVSKPILHSKSYKLLKNVNDRIPIALYMFVKYGFYGVFEKYFNTKPIIFTDPAIKTDIYKNEYTEYTTVGVRPSGYDKKINYNPHSIKILIKTADIDPFLELIVNSLMYSFDLSPLFAMNIGKVVGKKKEPSTHFTNDDIDDESLYWITLLGRIIFKNKYSQDRIQSDMFEHIDILNGYMDTIIKEKLTEAGIKIDDFFDLIGWIMEHFHFLVINYEKYSSSLENRYVEILYYILFEIIVGINKAFLELIKSKFIDHE